MRATSTTELRVPYDTVSNALAAYLEGQPFDDRVWALLGSTSRSLRSELEITTMLLRFHEDGRMIRLQVKHEYGSRVQDSSLKQVEVRSERGVLRPVREDEAFSVFGEDAELEAQRRDHELFFAVRDLVSAHGEQFLDGDGLEPDGSLAFIEVQERCHRLPLHRRMEPYTTVYRFIVKHEASGRCFSVERTVTPSGTSTLCEPTEVKPERVTRTEYAAINPVHADD